MRRRNFLSALLAGSAITFAGCSGDGGETPAAGGTRTTAAENDETATETTPEDTPTEEPTSTPEQELITIESHEAVEYEQAGESNVAVDGLIRNTSDQPITYAEVTARFLDDTNTVIGENLSNISPLLAGNGWKFRVDYYSEQEVPPSQIESYELFTGVRKGDGQPNSPNLEIMESELVEKEEFGETTKVIQGRIKNTGDKPLDYVEARGQFLNDDDVVVGSLLSNTENLQAGQGWAFEIDYHSETDTPVSSVSDYQVFVTT